MQSHKQVGRTSEFRRRPAPGPSAGCQLVKLVSSSASTPKPNHEGLPSRIRGQGGVATEWRSTLPHPHHRFAQGPAPSPKLEWFATEWRSTFQRHLSVPDNKKTAV